MFDNTNECSLGSYKGLHPFGLKLCTLKSGIGIWDSGQQGLSDKFKQNVSLKESSSVLQ